MPAKGEKITDEARLEILRKGREKAVQIRKEKAEAKKKLEAEPKAGHKAEPKAELIAEPKAELKAEPKANSQPLVITAPEPEEEIIYVKKPRKKKTVVYFSASEGEDDEPPPPPKLERSKKMPTSPTHPNRYVQRHQPEDGTYEPKYHHRERQELYKPESAEVPKTKHQLQVDAMFSKYYGS